MPPEPHGTVLAEAGEIAADLALDGRRVRTAGREARGARAPAEVGGDDRAPPGLAQGALPGVEKGRVADHVAVPVAEGLRPALELHQHLGVRTHPELVDAAPLLGAQTRAAEVDPAQGRERDREHDPVGDHLVGHAAEAHPVAAIGPLEERLQRRPEPDRPVGQLPRERVDDLVVASADVEALVGAGRVLDELVEEVEGAQPVGVEAELARHLRPHQLPLLPTAAARAVVVEPVGDRELVEGAGRRGCVGVAVRPYAACRRLDPALEHAAARAQLATMAPGAVEPQPRTAGVRNSVQIGELKPELLRERADSLVARVDELPPMLGRLSARELARRPAAAADPLRVRLVHRAREPALLQPVGAREAGEAGADDDDPRRRRSESPPHPSRSAREQARSAERAEPQQLASGEPLRHRPISIAPPARRTSLERASGRAPGRSGAEPGARGS